MQSKIANKKAKTIKKSFLNAMRKDQDLKAKLAHQNNCSIGTIERWLRNEDDILTTANNIDVVKDHFGLLEGTEILERESIGNEK